MNLKLAHVELSHEDSHWTLFSLQLRRVGQQVNALRLKAKMSLGELHDKSKVPLCDLVAIEEGTFLGRLSYYTDIAKVFDVALQCRFQTISEALEQLKTPPSTPTSGYKKASR